MHWQATNKGHPSQHARKRMQLPLEPEALLSYSAVVPTSNADQTALLLQSPTSMGTIPAGLSSIALLAATDCITTVYVVSPL